MARKTCPLCGWHTTRLWLAAPDRFHGLAMSFTVVSCQSCGGSWTENPPQGPDWAQYYDDSYHRVITTAAETSPAKWRRLATRLRQHKGGGALLDIGCSSGSFLRAMAGSQWTLSGIEMSPEVAARAAATTGASVFVGDMLDAPFPPSHFDAITAFDVLEHLSDPVAATQKVAEWLKPGGVLMLAVPNAAAWEALLLRGYWYGLEIPRHLYHYTGRSLTRLMMRHGLDLEWIETPALTYAEYSTSYLMADVWASLGVHRPPLSARPERSFLRKVVRKLVRVGILRPLAIVASAAGRGPEMECLFVKRPIDA